MFFGKIIAGLLGLFVAGPIGLVLGVILGHTFDRGLGKSLQFTSPENIEKIKQNFFETTFLLLGFIAKADGRVSEEEVAHTESIFAQMGLNPEQRRRAIGLFQQGAGADFQPAMVVTAFVRTCGPQRQLQQTLLVFLVTLALADQSLDDGEHAALRQIAGLMGFGERPLEELLRMARAQARFHQSGGGPVGAVGQLSDAYTALGVQASATDKEVKQAYRKLMSANHPDKLIAQGVPEDMVRLATEKSQEIQSAYELVKKSRESS